nr:hypothetical protein Iba_chr15bCG5910 [Ipomoea batatas]GMD99713.1 hypothetical protein Iba_chr15eCG6480 [Ipomoea batatas]
MKQLIKLQEIKLKPFSATLVGVVAGDWRLCTVLLDKRHCYSAAGHCAGRTDRMTIGQAMPVGEKPRMKPSRLICPVDVCAVERHARRTGEGLGRMKRHISVFVILREAVKDRRAEGVMRVKP